jgi:predicted metal-dependent hydrolase
VREKLLPIFQESYRELRPRAPMPQLEAEFFAFANVNNTIRLRDGKLLVRLSDLLESAPETVLRAIAHILLAKMYRKPIEVAHATCYRRYVSSHAIANKANQVRQIRGWKKFQNPRGCVYHLEEVFEDLNRRFFHGLMARPLLTWSQQRARNSLGHYDPAHNTIVISRIFDHPLVPRYAIEYLLYHEMLHLKHPVKLRGSRRCVHSAEFQEEERLFPQLDEAKAFLKRL